MEFVYDVKNWKKWWSMRFLILSTFFQAIVIAYATIPADWMPAIPDWLKLSCALGALGCAGLAGVTRVLKQSSLQTDNVDVAKAVGQGVNEESR